MVAAQVTADNRLGVCRCSCTPSRAPNPGFGSALWIRASGIKTNKEPSARGAISKVMRRLEDRKLIRRIRTNRTAVVQLLREDGSGARWQPWP